MEQLIPPNSIQALSSLLPEELMRILSKNPKSVSSSLDILAAYFSQMPVYLLFNTFQNSGIIELAEILREFVKSGNLLERRVQIALSGIFHDFTNLQQGQGEKFLFGALAFVTLCNISTESEFSHEENRKIEEFKSLIRLTFFDDSIVIYLMDIRDSKELQLSSCPCEIDQPKYITTYLLSIGWYRVLQDKMDRNLFDSIAG